MKYGFVLIELIVATLIASMIGVILMTALFQTTKFQRTVDNAIDVYTRAMLVQQQFERDVMGVFVPVEAEQQYPEPKKEPGIKKIEEEKEQGPQIKRKEIKKIAKIFESKNKKGMLDQITFITNNPMEVYWSERAGKAKPKVARIAYSIEPDKQQKGSFILFRQEGTELDLAKYTQKEPRKYELIDGIKSVTLTFVSIIEKESEKNDEMLKHEIKETNEWHSEEKQQPKKGEEAPRLPQYVNMKLELWDQYYKRDVTFTYSFSIPIELKKFQPKQAKQKVQPKREIQQKQTSKVARRQPSKRTSIIAGNQKKGIKVNNSQQKNGFRLQDIFSKS